MTTKTKRRADKPNTRQPDPEREAAAAKAAINLQGIVNTWARSEIARLSVLLDLPAKQERATARPKQAHVDAKAKGTR